MRLVCNTILKFEDDCILDWKLYMFIEYLSPTRNVNILQAEPSLITIDAVCAGRNALALKLPELSAFLILCCCSFFITLIDNKYTNK